MSLPPSLTVIDGGTIGCEYASVLGVLGLDHVRVISTGDARAPAVRRPRDGGHAARGDGLDRDRRLERAGIALDRQGQIEVDERFQTTMPPPT